MKTPLALLVMVSTVCTAVLPSFRSPFIISGGASSPGGSPADYFNWNDDGMNDAIVDWSVPTGKARVYSYRSTGWMHLEPVPISYVMSMEDPAFTLESTESHLTVGLIANPFMTDWNGDGLQDLLVGQLIEGKVRLYLNTGTRREPVFDSFTYLQADGEDVTATYS